MKIMGTHPKNKLEFNQIADGIYIGTNQCCQMDFDDALVKQGITYDVSLEKNRIDAPYGVDSYIWIPVEDHQAPTQEQLEFGVSVLERIVVLGKKVYVHCKNGHGRAPTLVAAYFIKLGKTRDEAIDLIKEKRPAIHLEDAQEKALEEFFKKHSITPKL